MAVGPGKYDDACTRARTETGAETVLLVVLGGDKGSGFSVQSASGAHVLGLSQILRNVADDIEREMGRA